MELLLLTCIQSQLLANRVLENTNLTPESKITIVQEIKLFTDKDCEIDTRPDRRNAL